MIDLAGAERAFVDRFERPGQRLVGNARARIGARVDAGAALLRTVRQIDDHVAALDRDLDLDLERNALVDAVAKMMELAGIDMLPAELGVPIVRHELTAGADGGEVLVAGSLGVLGEERHPTGGLDASHAAAARPMAGRIAGMGVQSGLSVITELDPADQAFLSDHRIDGTPVLPGVMGIEAFAEAALCWCRAGTRPRSRTWTCSPP